MWFVKNTTNGIYWSRDIDSSDFNCASKYPVYEDVNEFLRVMQNSRIHTLIPVGSNHHKSEEKLCT